MPIKKMNQDGIFAIGIKTQPATQRYKPWLGTEPL